MGNKCSECLARISLDDQIKEVRREIGLRERVYPRFVARKKLLQSAADEHLERLRAALDTLERIPEFRDTIAQLEQRLGEAKDLYNNVMVRS